MKSQPVLMQNLTTAQTVENTFQWHALSQMRHLFHLLPKIQGQLWRKKWKYQKILRIREDMNTTQSSGHDRKTVLMNLWSA